MSFSVATKTRPVATSGWPYSWPSKVGEVHAGVAGEKELPDGSTPERRESWSNVVQSEVVTAAGSNAVDDPVGPAWPVLTPANAGDPATPTTPATRRPTEAVVRSRRALIFEWKGTLHFYLTQRSLATAHSEMPMVPRSSSHSSLRRVGQGVVPAGPRFEQGPKAHELARLADRHHGPQSTGPAEEGHELALVQ